MITCKIYDSHTTDRPVIEHRLDNLKTGFSRIYLCPPFGLPVERIASISLECDALVHQGQPVYQEHPMPSVNFTPAERLTLIIAIDHRLDHLGSLVRRDHFGSSSAKSDALEQLEILDRLRDRIHRNDQP